MLLKTWHLPFILFLIIAISYVASGQQRPNLIIGGIWQTPEDQATNQGYADALNAEYVHTYDSGSKLEDIGAVIEAAPVLFSPEYKPIIENNQLTMKVEPVTEKPATSGGEVYRNVIDPSTGAIVNYARYEATDLNGLTDERLNPPENGVGDHYDTIYAHSGGARTAVTALLYQGVTADRLVLIDPADVAESEIQQLLDKGIDIDYYYYYPKSLFDEPTLGFLWRLMIIDSDFQHGDPRGSLKVEPLFSEELNGLKGNDAHIQMWATVLGKDSEEVRKLQERQKQQLRQKLLEPNGIPKSLLKKEFLESLEQGATLLSSTPDWDTSPDQGPDACPKEVGSELSI